MQEAHVHGPQALGQDRVDAVAGAAAVLVQVPRFERVGHPRVPHGVVAADAVGVTAARSIESVAVATTADVIGQGGAHDRVVAVAAVDLERAAHQLRAGEIEAVVLPVAQQPHRRPPLGGVDDPFDAAGGPEAHQADIHRPEPFGQDLVDPRQAAVGVGVVALETPGGPVAVVGIGAAHQVGVAALAAIERIVLETAIEQVVAIAAPQRVATPAAIEQVGAAAPLHHVVATAAHQLLVAPIAAQGFAGLATEAEATLGEEVVQPAGDIAERLVVVAVFVEKILAANFVAVVIDAIHHGVDQVLAEELGGGTIVLDQVEAGLHPVFVVAMVEVKRFEGGVAHQAVDQSQVVAADPAIEIDTGGVDRLEQELVEAIGGRQAVNDIDGGGEFGEAGIEADPIDHAIKTGAGGGGIAGVVADPCRHIAHQRVGIAVFVFEAAIAIDGEAQVIDAVVDRVDGVLAEQLGCGPVVLHQVVAGLAAVLVITVQGHKQGIAAWIAPDPGVEGAHLRLAQAGGVAIGQAFAVEGADALQDQLVEGVGGLGAPLDIGPGDAGLQAGVGHHRLHDAVEAGAGAGQIHLQGGEPAGHIHQGGVIGAVFIGQARAVGVERKTDVIDAVEHRIDQGTAVELAAAAIVLDGVVPGLDAVLIVAVVLEKGLQPLWGRGIAEPGVEGRDVGRGEHGFVQGADGPQALHQEGIESVAGGDAGGDGAGLIGAGQAGIGGDPAEHLVQPGAGAAGGGCQVGGVAGDGAHGRGGAEGRGITAVYRQLYA